MEIKDAKYTKTIGSSENSSIRATIDGIVMNVPIDSENRHYEEILKQVNDSTITIAAAD